MVIHNVCIPAFCAVILMSVNIVSSQHLISTFLIHAEYLCFLSYVLPLVQFAGFQLNVVLKQVGMNQATLKIL